MDVMTSTTPGVAGAPTGTVHAPRGVLVDLGPIATFDNQRGLYLSLQAAF